MNQAVIKAEGYRWAVLAIFSLVEVALQILWSSFLPITGDAAVFYGVTPLAIGFLSMLFMILYVAISLPSSWAISRFGVKKGVGFGVLLMGVFGLLRGLLGNSYLAVMICTVMLAIAQPFIINAITTLTARWFPVDERATATGLATLAQLIGIMIGMILSPLLVAILGIRSTLIVYGVIATVVCLLFFLIYRERPGTPPTLVEVQESIPSIGMGLKVIARSRDAILVMIVFCIGMSTFNAISTWIEQILAPRGFDAVAAGSIGGMMMLGGILGCVGLGVLSDKTHKRKLFILVGALLIIPGLLGMTFLTSFPLLLVAGALLGFFQLGLGPIIMEAVADVCKPATEATAQGVLWMFGQGISVICIFLMDFFRSESGSMTPFLLVFLVLTMVNLALSWRIDESRLMGQPGSDSP